MTLSDYYRLSSIKIFKKNFVCTAHSFTSTRRLEKLAIESRLYLKQLTSIRVTIRWNRIYSRIEQASSGVISASYFVRSVKLYIFPFSYFILCIGFNKKHNFFSFQVQFLIFFFIPSHGRICRKYSF